MHSCNRLRTSQINNALCFHVQGVFEEKWGPFVKPDILVAQKLPSFFPIDYDSGRTSVWLRQSLYNCVVKTFKKKKTENANAVWINCRSSLAKVTHMVFWQWPSVFNTAWSAKGHFPFGFNALTLKPRDGAADQKSAAAAAAVWAGNTLPQWQIENATTSNFPPNQ